MNKKWLTGIISLVLIASNFTSSVNAVVSNPNDIKGNKFEAYILNLLTSGTVNGYSDGSFKPGNQVTRGEMAKFIVNGFGLGADAGTQQFSDVPSSNPFYSYINILKTEGIVSGYSDGTYKPNSYVTRGETTKFIYNALFKKGLQGMDAGTSTAYSDVGSGNQFKTYIGYLATNKVVNGYSDGKFYPDKSVTRGEMSKMIDGARGLVWVDKSFDYLGKNFQIKVPSNWLFDSIKTQTWDYNAKKLVDLNKTYFYKYAPSKGEAGKLELFSFNDVPVYEGSTNVETPMLTSSNPTITYSYGAANWTVDYNGLDRSNIAINANNYQVKKYYAQDSQGENYFYNNANYLVKLNDGLYVSMNWGNGFELVASTGGMGAETYWNKVAGTTIKDIEDMYKAAATIKY